MAEVINTREIALSVLQDISVSDMPMHQTLSAWLLKYQYLDNQDRRFISKIVRTTLENQMWIDEIINAYSSVKVRKMKPLIRTIMRMSVCQMIFMDGVPEHAVCNEAVKLAIKHGFKGLKGFVNGVLRNIARNKEHAEDVLPDKEKDSKAYLSMRYSTPEWIVELFIEQYGIEIAEKMLSASDGYRETSIRVNTLKMAPEKLKQKLENEGVTVRAGAYLPYILKISDYDYLDSLESFRMGEFFVQDESSAIAGTAAGFVPKQSVIDVCAAPGGKSLNAAMLMNGEGHIESRDLTEVKVSKIMENIHRMNVKIINSKQMDATQYDSLSEESADIVIADLPCSGLGVIGRKTDIKYNMTKESMESLVKLQEDMLDTVCRYVKPGGILMYSTCTVNVSENIDQVRNFLKNHPFKLESMNEYLPETLHSVSTQEGWIQLLPGVDQCDGFFAARLRRDVE